MSSKKKKILIVDDTQFARNYLKKIIGEIGNFELTAEASNGHEALEIYKKIKPDLVTMDIIMPESGGIEAIEKILEFDNKAVIIVISSINNKALNILAKEKGAVDYIHKPFKKEQILEIFEKYM